MYIKKFLAAFLVAGAVFSGGANVLADEIYNNLDITVDATLEVLNTTSGSSSVVGFRISPANGDGDNGCNMGNGESVTFNVLTSNSLVASVNPTSITFTGPGCNDLKNVTVSGVGTGSATITLSAPTSNTTGGSFTVAAASFTVNVGAPVPTDSSAPVITPTVTPTPNASGWNNTDVTVIWTVNDPESTVTSTTGCDTVTLTDETAGTLLTCSATSAGGTSSESVTIKIDKTAPVITGDADPDANVDGWNNTDVEVSFVCADTGSIQSGIVTDTVAGNTLSTDGVDQSVTNTGDCIDAAGNAAALATVSGINIDKTGPTITGTATPSANVNGWNNTDVEVSFVCTPNLAPLDVNDVAGDTLTGEGANQSVTNSGTCTDVAGNTAAPATVSGINIDKTAPEITGSRTPLPNANGWNNTDVTVSFACSDALSGVDGALNTLLGATLSTDGAGQSVTNTGSCTDMAGNTNAGPVTVSDINIDKTAPVVTITTPADGGSYTYNQTVLANWSVGDVLSGIDGAMTTSTTANGAAIVTTPVGSTQSYSVSATDLAGNTTTVTNTYNVVTYNFCGFGKPVSMTWKEWQKASTLPFKFCITDTLGNKISNATAQLTIDGVAAVSSGSANVANYFRYDVLGQQYIFNASTKQSVWTIGAHTATVTLDDGTSYSIPITIKAK